MTKKQDSYGFGWQIQERAILGAAAVVGGFWLLRRKK